MAEIVVRLDADSIDALKAFSGTGGSGGGGGGAGGRPPQTPGGAAAATLGLGQFVKFGALIGVGFALVDILKKGLQQSKILGIISENIAKAMGLLIDLILMPFLPLIAYGLMMLYGAIIRMGEVWQKYIDLKDPVETAVRVATISPYALAQAALGDIGRAIGRWIGEQFTDKMIQSLIDGYKMWADAAGKTWKEWVDAFNLTWKIWADAFWKTIDEWKSGFSKWWEGITKIVSDAWKKVADNLDINLFTPIKNAITRIVEIFTKFSLDDFLARWSFAWKTIINLILTMLNSVFAAVRKIPLIGGYVPADIPLLAEGGTIKETGVAVVHKGETVVPAGQGGNTYNFTFNGYQDDKFIGKVKEVLRQEGARYQI